MLVVFPLEKPPPLQFEFKVVVVPEVNGRMVAEFTVNSIDWSAELEEIAPPTVNVPPAEA